MIVTMGSGTSSNSNKGRSKHPAKNEINETTESALSGDRFSHPSGAGHLSHQHNQGMPEVNNETNKNSFQTETKGANYKDLVSPQEKNVKNSNDRSAEAHSNEHNVVKMDGKLISLPNQSPQEPLANLSWIGPTTANASDVIETEVQEKAYNKEQDSELDRKRASLYNQLSEANLNQNGQKHVTNDSNGKEEKTTHQEIQNKTQDNTKELLDELENKINDFSSRFRTYDIPLHVLWSGWDKLRKSNEKVGELTDINSCFQKQQDLRRLQQDKARYLNKLSEIASARLQHNNPDIADLSDENRATKLAEKLSELYDNEWTDVFEATKRKSGDKVTDKDIALSLKSILHDCNETCRDMSQKQRSYTLATLDMSDTLNERKLPAELTNGLTGLQKNAAETSLKHVEQVIKSRISRNQQENVACKYLNSNKSPLCTYIQLCAKLTWYAQIQDPPLMLEFEGQENPTGLFRPYTVSGSNLEYVLWPAMLLHERGPIVAKGIAQFSKKSTTDLADTPNNADSTGKVVTMSSQW